jgi:hypothetical protein
MGARRISAIVFDHDGGRSSALITIERDHFNSDEREAEEISIHGPAETIHLYASAINACNDREAVEREPYDQMVARIGAAE